MRYKNGEIPESALVIFKRGWNSRDGNFYWGLPPSTYRKHLALVARALERTGRTLSPSDGWSTYRPYAAQVDAYGRYGNGAATPRKSSHGGFWEGRDTAAVDYGNWAWVYAKFGARAQAEFYADCRAVGLTPGMISKARGYPDEPWHVIDLDPWAPVPTTTPTKPVPPTPYYARPYGRSKEKTMIAVRIVDGRGLLGPARKTRTYIVGGGIFVDTTSHDTADAVSVIVQGYDATGTVLPTPNLTYRELYDWARGSGALSDAELAPYARAAGIAG